MSDDMLLNASVMSADDSTLSTTPGFAAGLWRNASFGFQRGALACQVEGCDADLSLENKSYCQKKRICSQHMRAECIIRPGDNQDLWRFCFQCGKLEPLVNFDGPKRSCRARLERRKLPPKRSMTWTAGSASSKASSSSMALLKQQQQQQQQLMWELQQQNVLLEQQQQQMRMLQQYPGANSLGMAAATAATPFAAAQADGLEPSCAAALSAMPSLDRVGLMQQMLLLSEQKTRLQAMRATMTQYQGISPANSLGPPTPGAFPHIQVPPTGVDARSPSQLHHLPGLNGSLHSANGTVPGFDAVPDSGTFGAPALHPAFSSINTAAGQFASSAAQQLKGLQAPAPAQLQQPALSAAAGTAGNASWPYAVAMPGFHAKSAPASKQSSLGGQSGSIAEAMADLAGLEDCDDIDLFAKPDRPGQSVADALASEFAAAFPELEFGMGDSHEPLQHHQQSLEVAASQHRIQQSQAQVQTLMQQAQLMQQQMQLTAAMGSGYVPNPGAGMAGMCSAAPPMAGMLACSSSAAPGVLGGVSSDPGSAAVAARQQQGRPGALDNQELQLQQLMQTVQVLQESIRELSVRVHGRDPPAPTSSPGTGSVGSFGGGPSGV